MVSFAHPLIGCDAIGDARKFVVFSWWVRERGLVICGFGLVYAASVKYIVVVMVGEEAGGGCPRTRICDCVGCLASVFCTHTCLSGV